MMFIVNVDRPTPSAKVHRADCYTLRVRKTNPNNGYRREFGDRGAAFAYIRRYARRKWNTGACSHCDP